ncbi:MAG: glycine--tRNA ligase subunit beta [Candidatus Aminicenantes bacterium]|nr:glycine--tRNA ligase subunit beta [Candidatus Aminicenantes bacterium]
MEFLLEILAEEMPPDHVRAGLDQLDEGLRRELAAARIPVAALRTCGTCRRLVVLADMAEAQETQDKLVIGPSKAVAFAPDGSPTAAALGFARSQGVGVEALETVMTEKGEYVGRRKTERGKTAGEILSGILPGLIAGLSFPKTMRWGGLAFRFSRPIQGFLCLLGGAVVPFEAAGLRSGDTTTGHKIHDPRPFAVRSFEDYRAGLAERGVVIDPEARRSAILAQVESRLQPLGAKLHPDPNLLDKLVSDIESPCVVLGSFAKDYLTLPLELLSTAMREGQHLFSVVKDKKQLPYFVGVADARGDAASLIVKGNERVLRARLEDARFFWEQDLRTPLSKRAPALKQVVFQEKLGSYEDKTQRIKKVTAYLCDKIGAVQAKETAVQAAELCKLDLVTELVREFPSLQGRAGGLFARAEGFPAAVAQAVYEHYRPVGLEDESPAGPAGAVLSLADKVDTIVGVLGVGVQTTGSSDPFGLRRNALGVCKVVLDRKLSFSFPRLLDKVLAVYGDRLSRPVREVKADCLDFFAGRLRHIFERMGFRYDLVNAALGPGLEDLYFALLRVKALDKLKASPQFEPMILMAKRVNNIIRNQPAAKVNPDLLAEKAERDLHSSVTILEGNLRPMIGRGDFGQAQTVLFRIQPTLAAFFDKVLVMAEEKKLRQNRVGLLQTIARLLLEVADYSQVVVEGEKGSG